MSQTVELASPPARLDPVVQSFLDSLARQDGSAINELSVEDARALLLRLQSRPVRKPAADVEDRTILVGPRGNTGIRIVRPKGFDVPLPVVMYFHGGGWVVGDAETHDRLVRDIACRAKAAVVFVDYTRAPEARCPVALEEAYAATKWIFEFGQSVNVDSSRIAVAGDSAGGNLATAVTMLAKERHGPEIKLQVLFYPVTDARFDTKSYDEFAEGYFLTREAMKWFWNHYAQTTAVREQPTTSPLRASTEQLRGLPPALIIAAECDVLRDEGEAYELKLRQAGVPVTRTRYVGMIHDFVMLDALSETAAARAAIDQATDALRNVFVQEP
ncbi:MAG TPA: alpha/beta hydrolase [Candidatus Dormibacteraeota bacterium]|nr:alpha/beta hydrolase [Candidatus Dormibacteraeota bacterium]